MIKSGKINYKENVFIILKKASEQMLISFNFFNQFFTCSLWKVAGLCLIFENKSELEIIDSFWFVIFLLSSKQKGH